MAVGYEKKGGRRRVRFIKGVSHSGIDYGPDYDEQECELDARSAAVYVREGRAVYVGDDTPPPKSSTPEAPTVDRAKAAKAAKPSFEAPR
jgi:hypothetical protein